MLLVLDGLGGLPREPGGPTELEAAATPNLDRLAAEGQSGLSQPIGLGITPGSGPGHLALFGYDPVGSNIGRGALSALGLGLRLDAGDLGVRLNFCTLDDRGRVVDRRAGRIETGLNRALVEKLNKIEIPGVELEFATESQHRAVLIVRGAYLSPAVQETDPQAVGVPPLEPEPLTAAAQHASAVLRSVIEAVRDCLGSESPANFVLMRGYAGLPELESLNSLYGLQAVCLATYPMYKGLARVAGMSVVDGLESADEQMAALGAAWDDHDYFFVHHKAPDARGEDGDFDAKAAAIEEMDRRLPASNGPGAGCACGDGGPFNAVGAAAAFVASGAVPVPGRTRAAGQPGALWRAGVRAGIAGRIPGAVDHGADAGARRSAAEVWGVK